MNPLIGTLLLLSFMIRPLYSDELEETIDGLGLIDEANNELIAEKEVQKVSKKDDDGKIEDHLEALKEDVPPSPEVSKILKEKEKISVSFNPGKEEDELLRVSKYIEAKMTAEEWSEVSGQAQVERYEVRPGDYLWKIAQRLFGSGHYYSKIWALNPHIKNPHYIEPATVLLFDTGSETGPPQVKIGSFGQGNVQGGSEKVASGNTSFDLGQYGDGVNSDWIKERQRLVDQGIFFQFASEETYDDLKERGKLTLVREYESYEPPATEIVIREPNDEYDKGGLDKNAKVTYDFKEGFFLNTFITKNVVKDLGHLKSARKNGIFIDKFDKVYISFRKEVAVRPGNLYSLYSPQGKVKHPKSARSGHRYTIVGQIKAIRPIRDLWECEVVEASSVVQRLDRVTVYTPKIQKIEQTFSPRRIEAIVVDAYKESKMGLSYGDVVYLDRGRKDGVALGNVFQAFSFLDQGTEKKISKDPVYKIGEITVISLTDNFATGLMTHSSYPVTIGQLSVTKTKEDALLGKQRLSAQEKPSGDRLELELNMNDLNQDILQQAKKIKLTDAEMRELDRKEREGPQLSAHEKDLRELERLEREMSELEGRMGEEKLDKDKWLEQQDLNRLEKGMQAMAGKNLPSVKEVEQEQGKKFMDEDINAKENPYGLTEYDIEEIDELLNSSKP